MQKSIKGNAGRKPPEPAPDHSVIDDWLRRLMPDLQPVLKALDELICSTISGLQYSVKWKRAYYGSPKLGWVIELAAYDVSANVVFHGGADFTPPPSLGTTDRTRYVKVTSVADTEDAQLKAWIKQAGKTPGWK